MTETTNPNREPSYVGSAFALAVLLPVIGLVWGLRIGFRGDNRGFGIASLAVVAALVWYAVLA